MSSDEVTGDVYSVRNRVRTKALKPGLILDNRFQIVKLIGSGGMGQVYEAKHVNLEKAVAVKVLNKSINQGIPAQRFEAEAKILAKFKHPNIVVVHDAVSTDKGRFIVMELLDGESLQYWLKRTPLENRDEGFIAQLIPFVLDVCDGLEFAHAKHVIHRDMKPENIFLHRESGNIVPKILDFGVAKQTDLDHKWTVDGAIFGTSGFIPPERYRGAKPDTRADIFSLGAVLYYGLTNTLLYDGRTNEDEIKNAFNPQYKAPSVQSLYPHISEELDRVILKALEWDPDNRYQTAGEFREALSDCVKIEKVSNTSEVIEEFQGAGGKIQKPVLLLVCILFLGALFVWFFLGRDADKNLLEETEKPEEPMLIQEKAPEPSPEAPDVVAEEKLPATSKANTAPESKPPEAEKPSTPKPAVERPHAQPKPSTVEPAPAVSPVESPAPAQTEISDEQVSELINEGFQKIRTLQLDAAEQLFEDALAKKPNSARALYGFGKVADERREYEKAVQYMRKALQLKDNPSWRIKLGVTLAKQRKIDEAIKEWRYVKDRFPNNQSAQEAADMYLSQHTN